MPHEARRAAVDAFLQRPQARRRCDLVRLDARKITGEAAVVRRARSECLEKRKYIYIYMHRTMLVGIIFFYDVFDQWMRLFDQWMRLAF